MRRKHKGIKRFFTFVLPLTLIVGFELFPFVWTLLTSFKPENEIIGERFTYLPQTVTLENYAHLFEVLPFGRYLFNSSLVALTTAILGILISMTAAYSISRFRHFRGRSSVMMLFLTIYMFPPILLLIPLFIIMHSLGLLDTYFALILAYSTFTVPFSVWMVTGFLDSIPVELEQAAMVDGCTRPKAFWRVVFPLASPGLAATGIYIFIYAWTEFLFGVMFTTSEATRTLTVGLNTLVGQFVIKWGLLTAGGIVTSIPVVVLFTFIQKRLIQGLTAGAVKG